VSADEGWFPEPFGPIYVQPPGEPCPHCPCCTLRLCHLAARDSVTCVAKADVPLAVKGCPCTATAEARQETGADEMCPGGCGCRLGTDDADRRECGCDEGCCEARQ
jgi:hypothetical protein